MYGRDREQARARRVGRGWALATAIVLAWPILVMLLVLSLSFGCATGSDGRRLGPVLVEHVLSCGLQTVSSAIANGGAPNYLEASRCHLELVEEQLGRSSGATRPTPSEDHGRLVVRAAELEKGGATDREVRAVAVECDSIAREQLDGEGRP